MLWFALAFALLAALLGTLCHRVGSRATTDAARGRAVVLCLSAIASGVAACVLPILWLFS